MPGQRQRPEQHEPATEKAELRRLMPPPVLGVVETELIVGHDAPVVGREVAIRARPDAGQRILADHPQRDRPVSAALPQRGQPLRVCLQLRAVGALERTDGDREDDDQGDGAHGGDESQRSTRRRRLFARPP
jgi:hypothetical protein